MGTRDKFDRTVAALQEAALNDAEWPRAAALVNEVTSASGHSLVFGGADPSSPGFVATFFAGTERRDDWERWYFADFLLRDEAIPRHVASRAGKVVHIPDLYTDREKRTSAAFNEFRLPTRSSRGLLLALGGPETGTISWGLADSRESAGWSGGQIKTVKRLAPHIRHFARVRCALVGPGILGASLAEHLGRSGLAIIHLDPRGRIVKANDQAEGILAKRDGLRDAAGMLYAARSDENAKLQASLSRALPPSGVKSVGVGGSLKITRRQDPAPLLLQIHPLGYVATGLAVAGGALVMVTEVAGRARICPSVPAMAFDLTPTESRVAVLLADGDTVTGIAVKLGVAESTVRSHLKRIFRKMGVSKQTELVRRVLSLATIR